MTKFVFESKDETYEGHKVFVELDTLSQFYDLFSHTVPDTPMTGSGYIVNPDALVFLSMCGTLETMTYALKNKRLGDAYAILRKFYDCAVINVYTNLYIEENKSLDNMVVKHVVDWVEGKETLPEYRVISTYIRNSKTVQEMTKTLYEDAQRYKDVRDRCNDSVHYNQFESILINDKNLHRSDRIKWLDTFQSDLRDIFILHIGYLFFLKGYYMSSDDYIMALELGITPEPDSQNWVATYIQDAIDTIVKPHRQDVVKLIKAHTYMHLE